MVTDERDRGGPSRRDFLKTSGVGALTMAVAGCNEQSEDGSDGGSSNETDRNGTGTGTPGGGGNPDGTRDQPFVATPAAVETEFAQEAESLVRATFLDERYTRIESIPGVDAPEGVTPVGHAVTYGHEMRLPGDDPEGQPTLRALSAGVLSLPNPEAEGAPANPFAERSLSELVAADEGNLLLAAAGLGPTVEWLNDPVSVEQREAEFAEGAMTVETFVGPVSAEPGPGLPDDEDEGFLDARAPRPQMMTVHTARGFVGGNVVLVGMIGGWRRPPTMGPPPTEIGPEMADLLADVYEDVVKAELFTRVLGEAGMLWGWLACNLDEMGPPPEDVDRTVEYDDYFGLDAQAQVELGYPDEQRSSSEMHESDVVDRTAPGVFDCESYDPEVHSPGESVSLTMETRTTAYPLDEDGAVPFGVVASPRADLGGEEQNLLASQPLDASLFSEIWTGVWDLVDEMVPFDDVDWNYTEPTEVESFPQLHIEGRDTEAKGFEGTVEYLPEGENQSVETSAYLYLARLTTASEVVVACAFSLDTGTDGFFDGQAATSRLFENAVGDVVRNPGTPTEWVDGSTDPNVVQICRDTRLETASTDRLEQPDPDLVEGRNTAIPFDVSTFDGTAHSGKELEYGVFSFDVANGSTRLGQTILDENDVDDLDTDSTDPDVLFDGNRQGSDGDSDLPVFELRSGYDGVTLTFQGPSGYVHDETTLGEGSDYSTTPMRFLRVGFITVSDPEDGGNYGDGDGGPADYEETVEAGFEFLKRTFPGGIAAYRHDAAIEGVKNVDGSASANETKDYRNARVALERIAKPGNNNWSYSGETMAHQTTESDARSQIRSNGFDVWLLVVPTRYYDFHRSGRPTGLAPGPNRLAVAAVEGARYNTEGRPDAAQTVAQEIGHRLGTDQYQTPTSGNGESNPLAQRDDGGTDQGNRDFDHARHLSSNNDGSTPTDGPGVVSRAYSLAEGEFVVPSGHEWDGGYEVEDVSSNPVLVRRGSVSQYGPTNAAQRIGRMEGYMSYSDRWVWTDSVITQDIIDGDFNRASGNFRTANVIFGGLNEVSAAAGDDAAEDPTPSLSDLQVAEATVSPSEAESTDPDAVVEVALYDQAGESVATTTVAPQTAVDGHGVEDATLDGDATFDVEFPPEAVEMRVAAETGEITANPITRALREAYNRLPAEGFAGDPEPVRDRVDELLASVETAMTDGEFGAARDELTTFTETELADTIDPEFEPAANQYDEPRMRALFDEMIGRLDGLAGDTGGGEIEVGEAPPWTDWVPHPSALPVFADSRGFYQCDIAAVLNSGSISRKANLAEPMANPFFAGYFATILWQQLGARGVGEAVVGPAITDTDVDPTEVPAETAVFVGNAQVYLGSFDTDRLDTAVAEAPFSESDTAGVYVYDDEPFALAYGETYVVGAETVDEVVTILETGAGERDRWDEVNDEVEWLYETGADGDFTLINHLDDGTISPAETDLVDLTPFTEANGLAQSASLDGATFTDATTSLIYPAADAVELELLRETLGADASDREFAQDGRFVQVSATSGE